MPGEKIDALWYTRCGVPTAIGVAARLGWLERAFAPAGIEIRSIRDSEDQKVRDSHFDHHLRYSVRQGGSSPALWARAEGRPTRVIGLLWTDESQQILTLPRTKIRTVKDLRSRRLALPRRRSERFDRLDIRGAAALRGYLSALSTEGLDEKDVEFVELPAREAEPGARGERTRFGYSFGDEVLALLNGEVDAIFVKDSRGKAVEGFLGAVPVIDVGRHPDPSLRVNYGVPRPLTVDQALLDDHPEVAERLLALVLEAGDWAREHPAETLRLVSQEVGTPEHFVALAHPDLHQSLVTDLREDWIRAFEGYKDFLLRYGFIARDVDVRAWIDPAPLAAVKRRSGKRALEAPAVSPP
jgi:ABC-type nitrate/sulfonate/bicarbonate transport system substrate-binding protein